MLAEHAEEFGRGEGRMGKRLAAYRAAAERQSPLTDSGLEVFERFAELYPRAYQ